VIFTVSGTDVGLVGVGVKVTEPVPEHGSRSVVGIARATP
jgi:hypothetical protein